MTNCINAIFVCRNLINIMTVTSGNIVSIDKVMFCMYFHDYSYE